MSQEVQSSFREIFPSLGGDSAPRDTRLLPAIREEVAISFVVLAALVNLVAATLPGVHNRAMRKNIADGFYREPDAKDPKVFEVTWHATRPFPGAEETVEARIIVHIGARLVEVRAVPLHTMLGSNFSYLKQVQGVSVSNGTFPCVALPPWTDRAGDALEGALEGGIWRLVPLGLLARATLDTFNNISARSGKGAVGVIPNTVLSLTPRRMLWTPNVPNKDRRDEQNRLVIGYIRGKSVVLTKGQDWSHVPKTDGVVIEAVWEYVEEMVHIVVRCVGPKGTKLEVSSTVAIDTQGFEVEPWETLGITPDHVDPERIDALVAQHIGVAGINHPMNPVVAYCRTLGLIPATDRADLHKATVERVANAARKALIEELDAVWATITRHIDGIVLRTNLNELLGTTTPTRKAVLEAKKGGRTGSLDAAANVLTREIGGEYHPRRIPMHRRACIYLIDAAHRMNPIPAETEAPTAPVSEAVEGTDANPPGNAAAPGDGTTTAS